MRIPELNFHFTPVQTIWTLTFAAHLVLLVVLLGRDRVRRFRWFTISIALVALRLVASRLLFNCRSSPSAKSSSRSQMSRSSRLLVLLELARRAFGPARRRDGLDPGAA